MITFTNAGIVGMMRTMTVELSPIRVNCVSPDLVRVSPKWEGAAKQGAAAFLDATAALEIDGGIQLI